MITGNLHFGMPWEAYHLHTVIPAMDQKLLPQRGVDRGAPLQARINHGRWVVDCECNGAEFAFESGIFMCQSCHNLIHGHQYRTYIFPKNRKAIEAALLQRPTNRRNWQPGEPVAQLKAENEAHKEELV